MALDLIVGIPKTGKSYKVYEYMKNDILSNKEVILFVPSFMKVKAEEEYINYLGTAGMIGVKITTIQDFIEKSLENYNYNLNEKYLSEIDKKLILSNLVKNEKGLFKFFAKAKDKQGFINSLAIYMDLIRKSDIDSSKIVLKNKILEAKINELLDIYKKYEKVMTENYLDYTEEMSIFLKEAFFNEIKSENLKVYFDGYNNFNNSEFEFIEKLLKHNVDVKITLCSDISDKNDIYIENTMDIFDSVNKTYLKLLKIADKSGASVNNYFLDKVYNLLPDDIGFLNENLFLPDYNIYNKKCENIKLALVTNPYSEASYIARVINEKIREGYRYNDFLIYTTDIEEYDSIIKRCFYEHSIPVYSSVSYKMEDSKIVQYLKYLLLIAKDGYKRENIISVLKFGLNDINDEEVSMLENYLLEFNIFNIEKKFEKNTSLSDRYAYDLEKLNDIRKHIIEIFKDVKEIKNEEYSFSDFIKIIYNHLIINGILKNHELIISKLQKYENDQISEKIAVEQQIWENIVKIFSSLNKIEKDKNVDVSYISEIFDLLINSVTLKNIPRTMDEVELADINAYSAGMKKIVFFVGVNENKFPNVISEDTLFKDTELEMLESKDVFLKETSIYKIKMCEFNIYKALSNITEKLYVLVPSTDTDLKTLRKSSLVTSIHNIMNIPLVGSVANDIDKNLYETRTLSKHEVFENMMNILNSSDSESIDYEKMKHLYKYFSDDSKYNEILSYNKDDSNLNKESIDKIFGKELVTSVSRLELFKKCPFSYFMNYSLGLKERKTFTVSSIDIGNFMHEVLEEFSEYLFNNNVSWHSLVIDDEFEKHKGVLQSIVENNVNKHLLKNSDDIRFIMLKNRLVKTMTKIVKVIATSFNQSSFTPKGYEVTFSENGVYAPIKIKIDDTNYMNIIGKIDRVDTYENDETEYVRIVDYKSSHRNLSLDNIKEGISLQLVTYLSAYLSSKKSSKKLIPTGMLYFDLSDKLTNMKEYTSDEEEIKKQLMKKLKLNGIFISDINLLKKMDKKFNTSDSMIDITSRGLKSRALSEEEYFKLLDEVKEVLRDIGKEIIRGKVKIDPNKKADYCKYCKYMDVCRKDICL